MKFKDIIKLIECKFELYYKGSYVGEFEKHKDITSIDWVLECVVKSFNIDWAMDCENQLLSIQLDNK